METSISYQTDGYYEVNDRPINRPLRIEIGTEMTLIVEDYDGIEITCGGDSGPVVRVEGGARAVLRQGY